MLFKSAVVVLTGCLVACGGTDPVLGDPPIYPENYAETYQEVRNCRFSLDHDLMRIRILASPDSVSTYMTRTAPFAAGAVVIKEQYDGGDTDCTGELMSITAMVKLDTGSSPDTLDWQWQEVDPETGRGDVDMNLRRCTSCHTGCGGPPEGHDGTCAAP